MAAKEQSGKMMFDMEAHMKQRGVTEFLQAEKKMHLLTLINTCYMFLETKHWMWTQWGGRWSVSAALTAMWKTRHVPDSHTIAMNAAHRLLLIAGENTANGGDYTEKLHFVAENFLYQIVLLYSQ